MVLSSRITLMMYKICGGKGVDAVVWLVIETENTAAIVLLSAMNLSKKETV